MSNDSQHAFVLAGLRSARAKSRAQAAFVLRDGTLNVPAAAIQASGKPIEHATPIRTVRTQGARTSWVNRDDGRGHAEVFATDAVVRLRVISPVAEQAVNRHVSNRLGHRGEEIGPIIAGTIAHPQGGHQVAGVVRDDRQLGEAAELLHPARAGQKVAADVMTLQAGRVDRRLGPFLDQAALLGNAENGGQEPVKSPFLRSRSCAF